MAIVQLRRGDKLPGVDSVVWLCRAHGLPEPERESRFDPRRRWRADYLWRTERVILEIDGGIYRGGKGGGTGRGGHSTVGGILRDMEKANAAQLAGFVFLRATPADVQTGGVVDLLRRALRKGRPMAEFFLHVTPHDADVVLYLDDGVTVVGERCELHGRAAHCLHLPKAVPTQGALLRVSAPDYHAFEHRGLVVPMGDHLPAVFQIDDVRLHRVDDPER